MDVVVLVFTAGVEEVVVDAQSDQTRAGPVLVEAAGVLLAGSHSPQTVELTDVAMTGVGYPSEYVSSQDSIVICFFTLTDWCTVRDADLDFTERVKNSHWSGRG